MSPEEIIAGVEALVDKYKDNISSYEQSTYNETELRIEFLNPLFELFGWDINNSKGHPSFSREVRHEANVFVDEAGGKKNKKPDYLFQLGSKKCFYLEAKKPSVNIVELQSSAFQTRRYGWSGNLGISVLSNFKDLVIYDCSIRPKESDAPSVARVVRFHYTEYIEKLDEIVAWLSRDSVVSGTFDFKLSCVADSSISEPFDDYFLDQIRSWRLNLSQDLIDQGLLSDREDLNSFVQRILNRILFLRICEDKEYERFEELKAVSSGAELYEIFKAADAKYDSGLFEMVSSNEPMPSTKSLVKVLQDLYYPNSSYDFNVVDPFVMSQIYDLFLCEEAYAVNGKVTIEIKADLVGSEGAVCTPRTVSDKIVQETIDAIYTDDPNRDARDLRVVDICAGSGVFLISAFERLCNELVNKLAKNQDTEIRRGTLIQCADGLQLSFKSKRDLLVSSIFGVDIDPAAVEVCRFNLLVKLLEDSESAELESFRVGSGGKILPNLDQNIKVGNSLVGDEYYSFDPSALSNIKLLKRVKPFDWDKEFGDTFDAVIGNPPYIRVQNIVHHSPEEYAFVKDPSAGFRTAQEGLPDKYQLFIERGLSLLSPEGYLGYIVPNKFLTLQGGATLRSLLAEGNHVRKIINFGSEQIFPNRLTYTCLLILGKLPATTFKFSGVDDCRLYFLGGADAVEYSSVTLGEGPWSIPDPKADEIVANLKESVSPLKSIANVFVGLQTSADDVYVITPLDEDENTVTFIDKMGTTRMIERRLLRPFIYKVVLRKYEPVEANKYLLFPYEISNGKAKLLSGNQLKVRFPLAFDYLKVFKDQLSKRSCKAICDSEWYPFGRSQSLTRFEPGTNHIVWSTLSLDSKYVLDADSTCFTGGGNGPYYGLEMKPETKESILYVLALLNHPFLESFIRRTSSYFNGGYYSHGKQFVEDLPIRRIDFSNQDDSAAHNSIIEAVKSLLKLGEEKAGCISPDQSSIIERAMNVTIDNLNRTISELYGLEKGEEQ